MNADAADAGIRHGSTGVHSGDRDWELLNRHCHWCQDTYILPVTRKSSTLKLIDSIAPGSSNPHAYLKSQISTRKVFQISS